MSNPTVITDKRECHIARILLGTCGIIDNFINEDPGSVAFSFVRNKYDYDFNFLSPG